MKADFLHEHYPVSDSYLVGVSGGRDSVALLELLVEGGYRELTVCHLNHGLRAEESEQDAEFVRELSERLGLACKIGDEDVRKRAEVPGCSLEMAAREARLDFFRRCAEETGVPRIFLAHHADDQVETILMRLFRGTGPEGLTGMEERQQIGGLTLLRPFLDFRRSELPIPKAFREDSSNASSEFLRNRLRNTVIPTIEEGMGRDIAPAILRMAEIQGAENAYLSDMAAQIFESVRDNDQLQVPILRELAVTLQRRVLHLWLMERGLNGIGFSEIERVRSLLDPDCGVAKVNLPGDRHVRRQAKQLFVE